MILSLKKCLLFLLNFIIMLKWNFVVKLDPINQLIKCKVYIVESNFMYAAKVSPSLIYDNSSHVKLQTMMIHTTANP